jgi:hypothetical protein
MKASKFIVLVGGILGILAFFLPLVSVERQGHKQSVSAYQVVKGLDQAQTAVDEGVQQSAFDADVGASAKKNIGALKGIVLGVFAPAVWLTLIGALGVARKRFGRVAGTFSFLLGLLGLGIGAILKAAAEGDGGIGLTLLLITGFAGVVGGLAALIKPEGFAAPQRQVITVPAQAPRMAA